MRKYCAGSVAAAGIPIRTDVHAQALDKIEELENQTPANKRLPRISPVEATLNKALAAVNKGDKTALETLRKLEPKIKEIPVNRARVRCHMRFGMSYFGMEAKEEAFRMFMEAQREAAKVGRKYFDTCRKMAIHFLQGRPIDLGYL